MSMLHGCPRIRRLAALLMLTTTATVTPLHASPAPQSPAAQVPGRAPSFDHVLLISIDGLRSDTVAPDSPLEIPNLRRLLTGASTLNARTACASTSTLPNHASMLTSRPVEGERGHGWFVNSITPELFALDQSKGHYVPSIFDVAHDNGVYTAVFVAKYKMAVFYLSWNGSRLVPPGQTPPPAANKVDAYFCPEQPPVVPPDSAQSITNKTIETLTEPRDRSLLFVHYRDPDTMGHRFGWDVSPTSAYMRAVVRIDENLGRLFETIDATDHLRNRTAIILTSDHGGSTPHHKHFYPEFRDNYTVPLIVWLGDSSHAPQNLYTLNSGNRLDPGFRQPIHNDAQPPIRVGESGNLALQLLGLPPIPGSVYNVKQDLRLTPGTTSD